MKNISLLKLLILAGLCCLVQSGYQYTESNESVLNRSNWNKQHTQLITKGRVEFEYTEDKGTHCLSKDTFYRKEFTFRIPKEYLICSCKCVNIMSSRYVPV
jgi:hypothetical protein